MTGVDVTVSTRALAGDALALAGGFFAAGYMAAGGEVRQSVSTATYTTVCYLTAAVVLGVTCVVGGQALSGYSGNAWLKLVAVTVGAQFLGHTLLNKVLRTTSATVVSLAILFEVPGAAFIAFAWLGQRPPAAAIPGLVLLIAGVGAVITSGQRAVAPSVPAE